MPGPVVVPPDPVDLAVDGRRVARAAVARTRRARGRGLLGRPAFGHALVLPGVRSVHTAGMRFAIDVATCDERLQVLAVHTVAPGRLVLPRRSVRHVIEATAGSFARWRLAPGAQLALVPAGQPGSPAAST